jgi:opacity protein-like surface antigen
MRALIIAAAAIVMTTGPSFAQSTQDERAYVTVGGGVAVSSDTTSGDVALEAGVRIAPNLFVFGNLGQFHNLQPSQLQPTVDNTDVMLSASGISVNGTARVPAFHAVGGLRYAIPTSKGFSPYVLGGIGFARLSPTATFTYSSGTLTGFTPTAGDDVTSQLVSLGDFTQPAASTAFMFTLGGGVDVPVAPHLMIDVGYRVSRIQADTPVNASSIVAGFGYRF